MPAPLSRLLAADSVERGLRHLLPAARGVRGPVHLAAPHLHLADLEAFAAAYSLDENAVTTLLTTAPMNGHDIARQKYHF